MVRVCASPQRRRQSLPARLLTQLSSSVFSPCSPWLSVLIFAAAGCAPGPAPVDDAAGRAASEALRRVLNTDNGLEVRTWIVSDNSSRIGTALMRHRDGSAVDPTVAAALHRNGLRFVRVPADELGTLLSELGVAPSEVRAWHGQVTQWRPVQAFVIGDGGAIVAVGDGVRRFEPGRVELMARSWTVPMEDGLSMNLQLLPVFVLPRTHNYTRLLGDRTLPGETFVAMEVEIRLHSGYAYIMTGESPRTSWPGETAGDGWVPDSGGFSAVGPEAPRPSTIGELLFEGGDEPPLRQMVVFVPKIPEPGFGAQGSGPGGDDVEPGTR